MVLDLATRGIVWDALSHEERVRWRAYWLEVRAPEIEGVTRVR